MIEIPLNSNPEQLFSITLFEQTYDIRITLNSRTGVWSISFAQNGEDLITNIALLGGVDILHQYNLPFKNTYIINLENNKLDATVNGLGAVSKLFILTDEEVENGSSV